MISHEPERVVTLGWGGEDTVIALGTIPVGMTRYPYWPDGIAKWNQDRIGSATPVLMSRGIDYEQIVLLRPDLILVVFSGIDEIAYNRLSRIAPVVAYRGSAWRSDWRDQTLLVGTALGRKSNAEQLIGDTDTLLANLRREHPEIIGKTFALITHFPRQNGVDVYLPGDPRFSMLERLGLRAAPGLAALGRAEGGKYSVSVSLEQLDILDSDILIAWFAEGVDAAMVAQPLLRTMPAFRDGAVIALEDPAAIWSILMPTAPAISYTYPDLVSRISVIAKRLPHHQKDRLDVR